MNFSVVSFPILRWKTDRGDGGKSQDKDAEVLHRRALQQVALPGLAPKGQRAAGDR